MPSTFRGKRFYHNVLKKRFSVKDFVYKRDENGAIGETHAQCESSDSSTFCYIPTTSVLALDNVWYFQRSRWNQLVVGRVFRDDEDLTKIFYVTDYRYFADRKQKCFHAVPYDSDEAKAKAMKDDEDDRYVWDV